MQEGPTNKNIFPLHLIKAAEGTNAMVELKSGQTYNGTLKGVDKFMNIKLESAVLSNKSGTVFHSVKEVYIKGNSLRYFSLDDNILSKIEETQYVCPENWKKSAVKQNKAKQRAKK